MDRIYLNSLFDLYGELLTEKEKECFIEYYAEDLSISEIAENNSVSRNAVHKMVKTVEDKLLNYESNLHLFEKNKALLSLLNEEDISLLKEKLLKIIS